MTANHTLEKCYKLSRDTFFKPLYDYIFLIPNTIENEVFIRAQTGGVWVNLRWWLRYTNRQCR